MFIVRFFDLLYREAKHIAKDPVLISIMFGTPILYTILFSFVYIEKRTIEIPVYLIDEDRTALSRNIKTLFANDEYFKILDETKTVDEFVNDMYYDKVYACIVIPKDFEKDIKKNKAVNIAVILDGSNFIIANSLIKGISEVVGTMNVGVIMQKVNKKGVPAEYELSEAMPVSVSTRLLNNPTLNYLDFLVPGLIATIMQQIALLSLSLSIARERKRKDFLTFKKITENPFELFFAKGFFYTFVNLSMSIFSFVIIFFGFGVKFVGDVKLFLFLLILFSLCLTSLGFCISSLLKDPLVVMEVLMLVAVPSFIISGYTWPQIRMTNVILNISNSLPLTHVVLPMRQIFNGATYPAVANHFMYFYIFIPIGLIFAYVSLCHIIKTDEKKYQK